MNPTIIEKPLVIMFENEHGEGRLLECHLYPPADYTYEHYGLVIADLIGHVADHYKVSKEDVLDGCRRKSTGRPRNWKAVAFNEPRNANSDYARTV